MTCLIMVKTELFVLWLLCLMQWDIMIKYRAITLIPFFQEQKRWLEHELEQVGIECFRFNYN